MNHNHEFFMKRCLELAVMGLGNTSPNPMVGSVIVYEGRIIGEGYHKLYGQAHAEVNAINSVSDKKVLKYSTLYVNLEPCSHFGKTPPCAELITRLQIPRVVIGTPDPNPLVLGKGIDILKKAGCEVIVGVCAKECEELNRRFFTFYKLNRPYIILKWAETADGYIDKIRIKEEKPEWISNKLSRNLVHKWRCEEQAVMIGTNTAIMDNPQLNVREWIGRNPIRVVIDNHLRLPLNLKIFDGNLKTIVYTLNDATFVHENVEFVKMPPEGNKLEFIFNHLYCSKVISVIVEGGAKLTGALLSGNFWDEARVFKGKGLFINGVKAPILNSHPNSEYDIDGVILKFYKNNINSMSK